MKSSKASPRPGQSRTPKNKKKKHGKTAIHDTMQLATFGKKSRFEKNVQNVPAWYQPVNGSNILITVVSFGLSPFPVIGEMKVLFEIPY